MVCLVMKRIRLLLVDDDAQVRRGLLMRLASEPDIDVVGVAASGSEALSLAQERLPDVVIMDLLLPGIDGIEATRELQTVSPGSKVIAISIREDTATRQRALCAGAAVFVSKHDEPEGLLAVIREVVGRGSSTASDEGA
jgi:two-component system, NarL family, response regulator LiaR